MRESDRKYVEEQLKTLDYGGEAKRELSTQRHRDFDSSSTSTSPKGTPAFRSKSFQPKGIIELPLRYDEGGSVRVNSSAVRTAISCNVPGEQWNAKFSGSTLVRGPMGAATGTVLMSYDVNHPTLQAVSQMAVGDQANAMCGAIYHTSAAWYGFGAYYYPKATNNKYTLQVQSEQKLEHGKLVLKFSVPTQTLQPDTTMAFTNHAVHCQLRLFKAQPQVDFSVSPRLSLYRKLKLSCQWRQAGIKVDAMLNQTMSKASSLGVGVRHDSRQGLSWLFTWIRGDVTIKIPIFLMSHQAPLQYICSVGLTLTSYLIQELLADLWKLEAMALKQSLPRSSSTINKARADAEKQRALMAKQANSRRATEEKKQGLVITKATYFCVGGDSWDVTTQLQFWTTKSSLDLPALSKQNLLGFYNVAAAAAASTASSAEEPEWWEFWKPKKSLRTSRLDSAARIPKLRVMYDYSGDSYDISIEDQEPLSLPSSKARRVASAT